MESIKPSAPTTGMSHLDDKINLYSAVDSIKPVRLHTKSLLDQGCLQTLISTTWIKHSFRPDLHSSWKFSTESDNRNFQS
jgi:hypothetical protein